jgi:hypothetical protein
LPSRLFLSLRLAGSLADARDRGDEVGLVLERIEIGVALDSQNVARRKTEVDGVGEHSESLTATSGESEVAGEIVRNGCPEQSRKWPT